MLTKTLTNHPPTFDGFLRKIGKVNATLLSHHFKPASLLCSTTGEQAAHYDNNIHIEGNLQKQFEKIFVQELGLPKEKVQHVLKEGLDSGAYHPSVNSRFAEIDPSIGSGLDRVSYYFQHSDPSIVKKIYKDDIAFGRYTYSGMTPTQASHHLDHLKKEMKKMKDKAAE